jgi:hypothetical protein
MGSETGVGSLVPVDTGSEVNVSVGRLEVWDGARVEIFVGTLVVSGVSSRPAFEHADR